MRRPPADILITAVLAAYGVYVASYIPALLIPPAAALLLTGRVLEAVFAFASAAGVWTGRRWASQTILALGLTIAAMWLIEAFVLGLVAYLQAIAVAVLVVVVCVFSARYVKSHHHPAHSL